MTDIIIAPTVDPTGKVQAACDMYTDTGFAPGSPGAKRGQGVSGFGTYIRKGQLVDLRHPCVRQNPSNFVTIARPVTLEDIPDE
jgi:hypothetical protein